MVLCTLLKAMHEPMPGCPVAWSDFWLAAAAVLVRSAREASKFAACGLLCTPLGQPVLVLPRRFCLPALQSTRGAAVDVRAHPWRSQLLFYCLANWTSCSARLDA